MSLIDTGINVVTAAATVGAVVAALFIARSGERRSDQRIDEERVRADAQLVEERARADGQLAQERERSDRERRIERSIVLLMEVYDLFADYLADRLDPVSMRRLHHRLAVLPWTVATVIRFTVDDPDKKLLNDPEAKNRWVLSRAGQSAEPGEVDWELLAHEFPADLWFLSHDQPVYPNQQWWTEYAKDHPPISGNISPGILPPHKSGS